MTQEMSFMVNFRMLKPDPIIQIFNPEHESIEELLGLNSSDISISKGLNSVGVRSSNISSNLAQYMVIAAGIASVLIICGLVAFCGCLFNKYRQTIRDKILKLINRLIFNGIIENVSFCYISICLAANAQLS